MRQKIHKFIFLTLYLLLSFSTNVNASINLSLNGIDDKKHSLTEYIGQGKWVVLNLWGTNCPPCREEIPELVQFHDEHTTTDAIVLGIAIDFPSYGYAKKDEVILFADEYLIDFPILLSDASITEKIGLGRLEGLPTTYLFTPEGKVVGMQVGGITKKILEDFIKKFKLQSPSSAKQ